MLIRFLVGLIVLWVLPLESLAVDYRYGIYQSAEYSDNIEQSSVVEEQEKGTMYAGGVRFSLESFDNPSVEAQVSGALGVEKYDGGDLDTLQTRDLDASLLFKPRATNFSLLLVDRYTQLARDRRDTQRVNNVNDIHIYAIVPRYSLNLSSVDTINAEYSYSKLDDRDPESELVDSSRLTKRTAVGYQRQLSPVTALGVLYRHSEIDYEVVQTTFEVRDQLLVWQHNRAYTQFQLNVGESEYKEEGDDEVSKADLVELSVVRSISQRANLSFGYREGIDQTLVVDLSNPVGGVSVNDQAGLAEVAVEQQQFTLGYDYNTDSLGVSADLYRTEQESIGDAGTVDELIFGGYFTFQINLSNVFPNAVSSEIELSYDYEERQFNTDELVNEVDLYSVRYNYFARRDITFYTQYSHRNSSSTIAENEITENSIALGISYTPRGRFTGF